MRLSEIVGSDLLSLQPVLSLLQVTRRGSWLVVVIACKTCFALVNDPDYHIRMAHADYPDVMWSGCIMEAVRMSMLYKRRLLFLEAVRIGEAHYAYP